MLRGEVHDPVEPLPEGEVSVGQGLAAELRPGDDQVLAIVLPQVWVSTKTKKFR